MFLLLFLWFMLLLFDDIVAVFIPNSIPSLVSGLCQLTELYSEQENFLMAKAIIPKIEIYLEATRDHSKFILLNLNLARGAYYGEYV